MVPLGLSILASCGLVGAIQLPWFGISTSDPIPSYSAISMPPMASLGLAPGSQEWGYLLMSLAILVAALGLIALASCVRGRSHLRGGPGRLLLCLGVASSPLVPVVILEMTATVLFGDQPLGYDWGAVVGGLLAALSTLGAWSAWATNKHRWLWGP